MLGRVLAFVISLSLALAVAGHGFAATFPGQDSAHIFAVDQIACCGSNNEAASDHAKAVHLHPMCSLDPACLGLTSAGEPAQAHRVRLDLVDSRRDGLQSEAPRKPPRTRLIARS